MLQLLEELGRDIDAMARVVGHPDLILFTGDLAFKGRECAQVDDFLDKVHAWLPACRYKGAPAPLLFAVPGNHDLVRPRDMEKYACSLLDRYDDLENAAVRELRASLWEQQDPALIAPMFQHYATWAQQRVVARLQDDARCVAVTSSFFPGDLSAILKQGRFRLGLVGLDSAWCQYDRGDFEGRLQMATDQLHAALPPPDPFAFFGQCDAALLLMHHPPSWLSPAARVVFDASIYPPDRFELCLFGHVHAASSQVAAIAGAEPRAFFQAHSIFGLDHYGTAHETRTFGYAWGEISRNGGIRLWPRKRVRREGGAWAFDRDQRFPDHGQGAFWLRRPQAASMPTPAARPLPARVPAPISTPVSVAQPAAVAASTTSPASGGFEAVLSSYVRLARKEPERFVPIAFPPQSLHLIDDRSRTM